jgi:hypothetical protein
MSRDRDRGERPEGGITLHGGFIRGRADSHTATHGLSVENPRPDELSPAAMAPRKGMKAGRKLKLAVLGIPTDILNAGDPRYAACMRAAGTYRKARTRELFELHGYVSAGASSLLSTAAINLAASRFLYEKFALEGDINLLKVATKLSDSARQNELAAWELCAREGLARKKLSMQDQGVPWLSVNDGGQKKAGRKTNSTRQEEDVERIVAESPLPEVGGDIQSWVNAVPVEGTENKG